MQVCQCIECRKLHHGESDTKQLTEKTTQEVLPYLFLYGLRLFMLQLPAFNTLTYTSLRVPFVCVGREDPMGDNHRTAVSLSNLTGVSAPKITSSRLVQYTVERTTHSDKAALGWKKDEAARGCL